MPGKCVSKKAPNNTEYIEGNFGSQQYFLLLMKALSTRRHQTMHTRNANGKKPSEIRAKRFMCQLVCARRSFVVCERCLPFSLYFFFISNLSKYLFVANRQLT